MRQSIAAKSRPADKRSRPFVLSRAAMVPPGGERLARGTRERMESQFGEPFDHVRVYRGADADRAARTVHARAFTIGSDIVLGSNADREDVIAHELAHVAQQRDAHPSAAVALAPSHSPLEAQAHTASSRVMSGGDAGVLSAAPVQTIQRLDAATKTESDETTDPDAHVSLGSMDDRSVDYVMSELVGSGGWHLVREIIRGFVGANAEAERSGRKAAIGSHLAKIMDSSSEMFDFGGGFLKGLVLGLVSPITDLFHLIKGGITLLYDGCNFLIEKAMDAYFSEPGEIRKRAGAVMEHLTNAGARAIEGIAAFLEHPLDGLEQLGEMMDALAAATLSKARGIGRSAAQSLMEIGELPAAELGEKIGYIVGAVAVQILMMVFTQAIGNALSAAGRAFAKGAQFVAGKVSTMLRAAMGVARSMMTAIKQLGGSVMKFFKGAADELAKVLEEAAAFFDTALAGVKTGAVPAEGIPNAMMMSGPKGSVVVSPGARKVPTTTSELGWSGPKPAAKPPVAEPVVPKSATPVETPAPQPAPAPKPPEAPVAAADEGFIDDQFGEIAEDIGWNDHTPARPGVAGAMEDAKDTGLKFDAAFQEHKAAPKARKALNVTGAQQQSAHVNPTSFLEDVQGYKRGSADTILLKPEAHQSFDSYWKKWAHNKRKKGRTTCSVRELRKVMFEAVRNTRKELMNTKTRRALYLKIDDELFRILKLSPNDIVSIPDL